MSTGKLKTIADVRAFIRLQLADVKTLYANGDTKYGLRLAYRKVLRRLSK